MPARRFRYIPHTADAKFIGYGKTFAEALENAALAMLNIRFDVKAIEKDASRSKNIAIKEHGDTKENVAWFVLQKILSKIDAASLSAFRFSVTKISDDRNGAATVSGRLYFKKTKTDYTLTDVKAVTPHEFEVKHNRSWKIRVVVDI